MINYKVITFMALALLITGCASQKLANSDELQSKALADAASTDLSPEEMISRASERLNNAEQSLRFYSPLHLKKAQEQLEGARKLLQSGKVENQTPALAAAILAEKLVTQAEDNREKVKQQLAPALAHREILLELGSQNLLPGAFNSAMSELKDLITLVESGRLDEVVKQQPALLEEFAELEAETLKVKWLSRANAVLEQAEDADADKFAPKSFEQAELAIERANRYTDSNYRDREGVKAKADEAFVMASKALNMTNEVQKVFEKKISEVEAYMLSVQSWLDNINQDVKVPDLAAMNFYEQSRAIAARVFEALNQKPSAHLSREDVRIEPQTQPLPEEPALSISPMAEPEMAGSDTLPSEADASETAEPQAVITDPEAETIEPVQSAD
jgi:hypothetical protein